MVFSEALFSKELQEIDAGLHQPTQVITIPVDQSMNAPATIKVRGNLLQLLASTLNHDLTRYLVSDTTARVYIRFSPTGVFLPFSLNPANNPAIAAYSGAFSQIDYIVRPGENHAGGIMAFLVGLNVGVAYNNINAVQVGSSNSFIV